MKLNELLYKTPEMTEEKLLELISKHLEFLKKDLYKIFFKRIPDEKEISSEILKEWDLIQEKNSLLTKSQRDQICALVSYCLIQMTKDDKKYDEYEEVNDGGNSTGESSVNPMENIQETT
jgi:hypothetical protein